MPKRNIKVTTIAVGIVILVALLLILPIAVTRKTIPESELNKVALQYASSRCYVDAKKESKNDAFCDDLRVTIGSKQEDLASVVWSAVVRREDTNEIYSSFMINSNDARPSVDESTYVLNIAR